MRDDFTPPPPLVRPAPAGWCSTQTGPIIAIAIGVVAAILFAIGITGMFTTIEKERAEAKAEHAAQMRQIEFQDEKRRIVRESGLTDAQADEHLAKVNPHYAIAAARLAEAKQYLGAGAKAKEPEARKKALTILREIVDRYFDTPAAKEASDLILGMD